jgi:hypothetical protein
LQSVLADNEAWMASTNKFVLNENARLSEKQKQMDVMHRQIRHNQTP